MKKITPKDVNYSKWYSDVIREAKLASRSSVKGCMVIRPNGFVIWEKIKSTLDEEFKKTGHINAYFPIFIPKSFLNKEAEHVEGFAKECAIVTHYRLKHDIDNNLIVDEEAKLEEELIVRPTSETIIWNTYKTWIQSYRDLPILINQWANVVRWEMRTRLFLRTTEFLWQEGHTAHETYQEAEEEAVKMINIYKDFVEGTMAIPVIVGRKSNLEKFAGALHTYTIEGMMQDKKALQMGTSHNLGQNFAKAFDVNFLNKKGLREHVWATSWGVSTRLIGALIMTHSDDRGLVLPPKLAKLKVVIIPIFKKGQNDVLLEYAKKIKEILDKKGISSKIDDRNNIRAGNKFNYWDAQGIPIKLEIGVLELKNNTVLLSRRDNNEKVTLGALSIDNKIKELLEIIQEDLLKKAIKFTVTNTHQASSINEVEEILKSKGGFIKVFWEGSDIDEGNLKSFNASIRCIIEEKNNKGRCIVSAIETNRIAIIAKSY